MKHLTSSFHSFCRLGCRVGSLFLFSLLFLAYSFIFIALYIPFHFVYSHLILFFLIVGVLDEGERTRLRTLAFSLNARVDAGHVAEDQ